MRFKGVFGSLESSENVRVLGAVEGLGLGFWVLGFGFWVLGFGFWVLGALER